MFSKAPYSVEFCINQVLYFSVNLCVGKNFVHEIESHF